MWRASPPEAGDDQVLASGGAYGSGLYNDSRGQLHTGDVSDTIKGTGWIGLSNFGTVDSGTGDDLTQGDDSGSNILGIYNLGVMMSGDGNDTVSSANSGILNENALLTGQGNDVISANGGLTVTTGLPNYGQIDTGTDGDTILLMAAAVSLG